MKKLQLIILFLAGTAFAQPQWRQVFKSDSTAPITSLVASTPQDPSIDPKVVIILRRNDFNNGCTVALYDPLLQVIDTIGRNNVNGNYCQQAQRVIYTCDNVRWMNSASYDTSRVLSGVEHIVTGDAGYCGSDCYDYYRVQLTQTVIRTYCSLQDRYCSNVPFRIYFHPSDGTILYGLTDSGLVEDHSVACPHNWTTWPLIKRDSAPNFFYIAQDVPNIMFLNAQDTLWRSSDGGTTWSVSTLATINAMAHVPHTNYYAAASADSLSAGLYVSADGGNGFIRANRNTVFSVDADQINGTIYAGTKGAILQFNNSTPPSVFDSVPNRNNVIGVVAIDGKIIYADSEGVYETDAPNAVQEPVAPNGSLSIENYPNPFSSTTTLKLHSAMNVTSVKIYDIFGREVADMTGQKMNSEIVFDGSDFPAGTYMCRVTDRKITLEKLMVILK